MHVRRGRYIGVAPMPGGLTNVCLVRPSRPGDAELRDPAALLARELPRDPLLRDRVRGRAARRPAGRARAAGRRRPTGDAIDGLLLAGDAAGFIDPMTGDGLRFAVRGGELAAAAALDALEHGWHGVHARLAAARAARVRAEVALQPRAARAGRVAARGRRGGARRARRAARVLRAVIARAGDCDRRGGRARRGSGRRRRRVR